MKRLCYVCGQIFGVKEPLNDKRETSGICPFCLPGELEKLKKWKEEQDRGRIPEGLE